MDDNAPIHRAGIVKDWCIKHLPNHPYWPPYSLDINPIENILAYIKSRLEEFEGKIHTLDDLKKAIDEIWHSLSPNFISNYIYSVNRRLPAVDADGYHTKY